MTTQPSSESQTSPPPPPFTTHATNANSTPSHKRDAPAAAACTHIHQPVHPPPTSINTQTLSFPPLRSAAPHSSLPSLRKRGCEFTPRGAWAPFLAAGSAKGERRLVLVLVLVLWCWGCGCRGRGWWLCERCGGVEALRKCVRGEGSRDMGVGR